MMFSLTPIREGDNVWKECQKLMANPGKFLDNFFDLDIEQLSRFNKKNMRKVYDLSHEEELNPEAVLNMSMAAYGIIKVVRGLSEIFWKHHEDKGDSPSRPSVNNTSLSGEKSPSSINKRMTPKGRSKAHTVDSSSPGGRRKVAPNVKPSPNKMSPKKPFHETQAFTSHPASHTDYFFKNMTMEHYTETMEITNPKPFIVEGLFAVKCLLEPQKGDNAAIRENDHEEMWK